MIDDHAAPHNPSAAPIPKLLQAAFQSSSDPLAILVSEGNGTVFLANAACARLVDADDLQEIIGLPAARLLAANAAEAILAEAWHTVRSGKEWRREVMLRSVTNRTFLADVHVDGIVGGGDVGEPVGYALVRVTDKSVIVADPPPGGRSGSISGRVAAQDSFLAVMSHEIRTPLNAIVGMIDLLSEEQNSVQRSQIVGSLRQASDALLSMINYILDYARIRSHTLTLAYEDFDVREMVRAAGGIHRPDARDRGLAYDVQVDKRVPRLIHGDGGRIGQILGALLSNAVKFTESGAVRAFVSLEPNRGQVAAAGGGDRPAGVSTDPYQPGGGAVPKGEAVSEGVAATASDESILVVRVRDTGIGIPEPHLDQVFEPFVRITDGTGRLTAGVGLGLSIVRRLVELMRGMVRVDSIVGVGTTFVVRIPVRAATRPESVDVERETRGLNVLYVEDVVPNQLVMLGLCSARGVHLDVAGDGYEGIRLAAATRYDAILMDIRMPGIDGLETTRRIRRLPSSIHKTTPILAVTAFASDLSPETVRAAGINGVVPKPIDSETVFRVLADVVHARRNDGVRAGGRSPTSGDRSSQPGTTDPVETPSGTLGCAAADPAATPLGGAGMKGSGVVGAAGAMANDSTSYAGSRHPTGRQAAVLQPSDILCRFEQLDLLYEGMHASYVELLVAMRDELTRQRGAIAVAIRDADAQTISHIRHDLANTIVTIGFEAYLSQLRSIREPELADEADRSRLVERVDGYFAEMIACVVDKLASLRAADTEPALTASGVRSDESDATQAE